MSALEAVVESPAGTVAGELIASVPVHIRLDDVVLAVPHFVQRNRQTRSWMQALLGAIMDRPRREFRTILDGVSFHAEQGDRVALLGRNGAGKTTLLHVLSGAFEPTSGTLRMQGSRQALLNISLGFNHEATVRENIFLRGSAIGMNQAQILAAIDPILDFSELADVAHHRLSTLSAGQRLRLAFAISTSVRPDILLLDEWISAGDAVFLRKARARMQEMVSDAGIVVLASHSFELLKQICNKGVVIEAGQVVFAGSVTDAIAMYKAHVGLVAKTST